MTCDFCGDAVTVLVYPAKRFVMHIEGYPIDWGSDGGWAACRDCSAFIERGDLGALVERVMPIQARLHSIPESWLPQFRELLGGLYESFDATRTGPPRPASTPR